MRASSTLFLLFALIGLTQCDHSIPLAINEKKNFHVDGVCGGIDFNVSTFSRSITVNQRIRSGTFEINFDSLRLLTVPEGSLRIKSINFYDSNQKTANKVKIAQPGDQIQIEIEFDKPVYSVSGSLLILPCQYFICNKQALIQDTLQIRF